MEKKPASIIQSGLIITVVLAIYGLIIYISDLYSQQWLSYLTYFLLCLMIIIAVINYAKSKNGLVTFGQAFMWGFKTTAIVILFYAVYSIIFLLIFPEFKDKLIQITREGMEKQNTPDDQMETALSMMDRMFYLFMFLGLIFFFLLFGVIGSLLGAAFAKKKPISPFDRQPA
ncbi:MAG TPA: DUF4199 domain-containing protein [Chitinophagaceae bacterium]|nr:DUF4199 domain-containing protein [Chitinophagaceae bacterium]